MVRLALSYSSGVSSDLQFLADGLPAGILVAAGDRIGENRQGDRPEAGEAGENLLFFRRGGPLFLLDGFEGADGGDDVAGLGLLAAGDDGLGAAGCSGISAPGVGSGVTSGMIGGGGASNCKLSCVPSMARSPSPGVAGPAMGPDGRENQPQAGAPLA